MAITFREAHEALLGAPCAPSVTAALVALGRSETHAGAVLDRLLRSLLEGFEAEAGHFVIGVLRSEKTLGDWVEIVTGERWDEDSLSELYADCYLALDEFVLDWNRRQIRLVA